MEISDRQMGICDSGMIQAFGLESQRLSMGIVVDISCDLSSGHRRYALEEKNHVKRMIRMAQEIGAYGVRLWLGGQSLSIQKLYYRKKRALNYCGISEKRKFQSIQNSMNSFMMRTLLSGQMSGPIRWLGEKVSSQVFFIERKIKNAVKALGEIMQTVGDNEFFVAVENHWGISSYPENLISVIRNIGSKRLGTCVDFTNFPSDVNPLDGIRKLIPYAFMAHAKRDSFNKDIERRDIDFQEAVSVLKLCGFDGILTAEYDGPGSGLNEYIAIRQKIRDLW
jgi:sugar phosphate isomerase/epimerase